MSTDIFAKQKQQWIEEARVVAHKLLKKYYSITIEDVLQLHPLPRFMHRNTIGNVFNQKEFKRIGYEPSKKPSSHGRVISVWAQKLPSDYETRESIDDIPMYRKLHRKSGVMEMND